MIQLMDMVFQTNKQTNKQTDKQTNKKQTKKQTNKHMYGYKNIAIASQNNSCLPLSQIDPIQTGQVSR